MTTQIAPISPDDDPLAVYTSDGGLPPRTIPAAGGWYKITKAKGQKQQSEQDKGKNLISLATLDGAPVSQGLPWLASKNQGKCLTEALGRSLAAWVGRTVYLVFDISIPNPTKGGEPGGIRILGATDLAADVPVLVKLNRTRTTTYTVRRMEPSGDPLTDLAAAHGVGVEPFAAAIAAAAKRPISDRAAAATWAATDPRRLSDLITAATSAP